MINKEKYETFLKRKYAPVYSQPWWMDAVCLPENWDVWLYEQNGEIWAAMPYYMERRGDYLYITKAPLTQNNGIIFSHRNNISSVGQSAFEEKVIDAACEFIESLKLGVYEQQYQYSFKNYLPFFWNGYQAVPRYTYVIDRDINKEDAWGQLSSNYRNKVKKGQKNGIFSEEVSCEEFYREHEKVFLKQGLKCPFSHELWERLYNGCAERQQGKIFCYRDAESCIMSLLFLVWDSKSAYQLLGGNMPEFQRQDTYDALIWKAICFAKEKGLVYDFEGSMIKRISKSFREFGGTPRLYFRIRKIFHKEIAYRECEEYCKKIDGDA